MSAKDRFKLDRDVLVQLNPQRDAATRLAQAPSRHAITSSLLRRGYDSKMSSIDKPSSRFSNRTSTGTRVPRKTGRPPSISGSQTITFAMALSPRNARSSHMQKRRKHQGPDSTPSPHRPNVRPFFRTARASIVPDRPFIQSHDRRTLTVCPDHVVAFASSSARNPASIRAGDGGQPPMVRSTGMARPVPPQTA
jgi:hypothetical protein